ncbi:EAL domain-containing protein [Pseudanabaena sp. PCC 6802]|uniref:EAL domain-containing protein n=1 Tax=Pseudanabaena sp. PCC 6802 TaxID=118173 RepID=UPI00034C3EA4|nr:EAL domain-containing protein [Pseudanabaena sp. PCC 6802]
MSQREDTTVVEVKQQYHYLIIEDAEGQRKFLLDAATYSIGRNPTNGIVLRSQLVSRQHAILLRVPVPKLSSHMFRIIDGNLQGKRSKNGILIDGKRCFSHILAHGNEIVFSSDTRAYYQVVSHPSELVVPGDTDADEPYIGTQHNYKVNISDTDFANYNAEALARLASFPELNPNPILEINFSGAITYLNPAATKQFPELYELGSYHPLLKDLLASATELQNGDREMFTREVEVNGLTFEQFVHYLSGSNLIRCYVIDITERKRSQEIIQYQAYHDALTGLPNRKHFSDYLTNALAESATSNEQLAVIFIDLDRFKSINDSLGHDFGDLLLRGICHRLREFLHDDDMLSRWGGDEFILLVRNVASADLAFRLAQKMLKAFEQPFICAGRELYVSASMGISLYPFDGDRVDSLIKNADTAMYRAKQSGRNSCQLYAPQMNESAFAKLSLENSLCQAIERDELVVYYQVQVDMASARISGVEALIRWQHPEFGLLSPDRFVPLAEETGSIVTIGNWLLRAACMQSRAWQLEGLPTLHLGVNISTHQFKQPDFIDRLTDILTETQLDPHYLDLELTESIIMEDIPENIQKLHKLRDMGINLSIDDFGTGYSSLSYLKRLPINVLKIDRSFIKDINTNNGDRAIAISAIALAHNLNLRVVAEGVETREQMELLRSLKCNEMQGYLFNKPLPANELAILLANQKDS